MRGEKKKWREKERKKGVQSDNLSRRGKECRGERFPPPWIQRCPAMSSWLTLCRRGGSSEDRFQEKSGEKEQAPQGSVCCPCIGAFTHVQNMFAYVQFVPHAQPSLAGSRAGPCASAMWFFPAGCCGGFFRGQEQVTTAKSRQKQFVAVFYILKATWQQFSCHTFLILILLL